MDHIKLPAINIYCYRRRSPSKWAIEPDISPLTYTTLETLQWCLNQNRNLILAYPEPTVRTISLMSYLSTIAFDKASIIFTRDVNGMSNAVRQHTATYSLLEDSASRIFLYKRTPLGELAVRSGTVEMDLAVDLSRVRNKYYRRKYESALQDRFRKSTRAIVVSSESYSEIVDFLDAVKLDGRVMGSRVKLTIGSVFFENLDRMVNSPYSLRTFLDWLGPQIDDGLFFFGHFANPHSPYISPLSADTDSLVLHYGSSLILNNHELLEPRFLSDLKSHDVMRKKKGTTLSMLLLDSPLVWTGRKPPRIISPNVDSGNIDGILPSLRGRGHAIMTEGGRRVKYLIGPLVKLVRRLPRIAVHPNRLKLKYRFETGDWRTLKLQHYLDLMFEQASALEEGSREYGIELFLKEFKTLIDELDKTARFGIEGNWVRKGKPWRVLDFISRWLQTAGDRRLIIAVGDYEERRLLSNDVRELLETDKVEVRLIGNLAMSVVFPRDRDLLLPFPLTTKNFSEYLKPYNQIYMLVYEGREYDLAAEHVGLVQQADLQSELLSVSHLSRTFHSMGLDPQQHAIYGAMIMKEEAAERILPDLETETPEAIEDGGNLDPLERRLFKLLERQDEFPLSREDEEWHRDAESIDAHVDVEEEIVGDKVVLELTSVISGIVREVSVRPTKAIIASEGEVSGTAVNEFAAEDLREGMKVVLPFGETRRDMTDIVVELFGEDKDIDTELLAYWKEVLCEFRSRNRLSYRGLYNRYRRQAEKDDLEPRKYMTVLHWTKEWRIAPQRVEDLVAIGGMAEDPFLVENAQNIGEDAQKMRSLRSRIGMLMNKVIKEVLTEGVSPKERKYEEAALADLVSQSLFEVTSMDVVRE